MIKFKLTIFGKFLPKGQKCFQMHHTSRSIIMPICPAIGDAKCCLLVQMVFAIEHPYPKKSLTVHLKFKSNVLVYVPSVAGNSLMLQVIERDIFTLNIHALSKFIFNWIFCILFAKSGNPSCHCLLRDAQTFLFAVGGVCSFGSVLGEPVASHCPAALGAGVGARLVIS